MDVVFTPAGTDWRQHLAMANRVRTIYRRLYSVFGVCTQWRDLCLARPIFWKIVPMCDFPDSSWCPLSAELSFQRSGGQDLNIVMDGDPESFGRMKALDGIEKHLARTRTLNFYSRAFTGLHDTFNLIMVYCVPEHMSQLSLCIASSDYTVHREIFTSESLNDRNSEFHNQVTRALSSLTSFRITEVRFDWKFVTFSTRLFELRLKSIRLAGSSEVTGFMNALSSASELRELTLIRILASADQGSVLPQGRPVVLPRLKSFYLEDSPQNFIMLILTSITPRSYRLTLFLSRRAVRNLLYDLDNSRANKKDLYPVLAGVPVHELRMSHDVIGYWTSRDGLHGLLESMPNLKILRLEYLELNKRLLQGLCPPQSSQDITFPKLQTIEFLHCYEPDDPDGLGDPNFDFELELETVVNSHPLERMVLGLTQYRKKIISTPEDAAELEKRRNLIQWLQLKVPFFQFIPDEHSGDDPEQWNLWEL
ncbi:hypothetical protein BN14_06637 [Rhizoctonia solani AG-1 IB]|uniref:F-box domain-containing protein n=2 Tax=Thanatephorus cucumeris (strain AG1-IB / isolate 7/3/14) TaxID=1108050 RepID=M5C0U2_THACB|nr:hypothetical protein BN14_06637 [Rhizoctonia solani AG-1 IB]